MMANREGPGEWKHPLPAIAATESTGFARRLARRMVWCLIGFLLVLAMTPWQQNVSGLGRIVAYVPSERQQMIEATVEGRLKEWRVVEGSQVKAGEIIGEINDYDPDLQARIDSEIKALEQRIDNTLARVDALENQANMLEKSRVMAIDGADARVKMAEERLKASRHALEAATAADRTAGLNLDRQNALQAKGLASRRTFELAELERTQKRMDRDRSETAMKAAQSELDALMADRQKLMADTAAGVEKVRSDLAKGREDLGYAEAERLKLETRRARQRTQEIRSPRDGTIFRLLVNPGAEVAKPGDALAILVPVTRQRAVELWVDGNDAPLMDAGRKVRLQFEGYPAIQFAGWPETAVGTFGGVIALVDATDNGKGDFRILVLPDEDATPWPDERFLRQGTRTNGWVLLSKVRLGYELWRNFNGFPPLIRPHMQEK